MVRWNGLARKFDRAILLTGLLRPGKAVIPRAHASTAALSAALAGDDDLRAWFCTGQVEAERGRNQNLTLVMRYNPSWTTASTAEMMGMPSTTRSESKSVLSPVTNKFALPSTAVSRNTSSAGSRLSFIVDTNSTRSVR